MGMVKEPTLNLEPEQVLCSRHGEPFRARWPEGFAVFTHRVLAAVLMEEAFVQEVEAATHGGGVLEELVTMKQLLAQKPLCCRLPALDLLRVYGETNVVERVWRWGVCALCGQVGYGGPYREAAPNGEGFLPVALYHVCLICVCCSE